MTRYYSSGDLAALCGVERSTASNWIARGYVEPAEIITVGGSSIWTEEQAQRIRTKIREREALRRQRALLRAELKRLQSKSP